ncbi:TPA: hypothetical protein PMB18_001556 [Vibrio cholerae]|nr:hypothetical protein [Vibrio cholerae]
MDNFAIGLMVLLFSIMCALLFIANIVILKERARRAEISSQIEQLNEKHSAEVKELNRKILKLSLGDTLKRLSSKDEGAFVDMDEISNLTKMAITFGYNKGIEDTTNGKQVSSDDLAEHYYNEFISGLIK